VQIGYKIATESFSPAEVVEQAHLAEQAGFDFVEMSDHYHPWLESQGHSGFTWSMLGAMAASTERIGLVTGVTCPSHRYHPAIIAQAAATVALLSDGRFTLGVGAGERLNEHVVGMEFPSIRKRHEAFRESLEIIKLLWQGGYRSYEGKHLQLEDARVFDLPDTLPLMPVAAGGPVAARIAAELGDGLFATEPRADLVQGYRSAGGRGPLYAEVPLAWAPDEDTAAQEVLRTSRWALLGWKVMAELPNPVNFAAATETVTPEHMAEMVPCGPDPERHVAGIQTYIDAGFERIAVVQVGDDQEGFLRFWTKEVLPRLG
jgi:G6PDH family F420-dependent oxidoreductase